MCTIKKRPWKRPCDCFPRIRILHPFSQPWTRMTLSHPVSPEKTDQWHEAFMPSPTRAEDIPRLQTWIIWHCQPNQPHRDSVADSAALHLTQLQTRMHRRQARRARDAQVTSADPRDVDQLKRRADKSQRNQRHAHTPSTTHLSTRAASAGKPQAWTGWSVFWRGRGSLGAATECQPCCHYCYCRYSRYCRYHDNDHPAGDSM